MKKFLSILFVIILSICFIGCTPLTKTEEEITALGTGVGYKKGRVAWSYNENAFFWNGVGAWAKDSNFDDEIIYNMVKDAICSVGGNTRINTALDNIFIEHNRRVNNNSSSYKKGEKIAIKGNLNNGSNAEKSGYFPAPATVRALLNILVDYGVEPSDITYYDTSRSMPMSISDISSSPKLSGVKFSSYDTTDHNSSPDTSKPIIWSDEQAIKDANSKYPTYQGYPMYNRCYYPYCVTEATYLINLFNLRAHTLAGFTASAKNHFGSIIPGYTNPKTGQISFPADFRSGPPTWAGLHRMAVAVDGYYSEPLEKWDCPKREMGTYTPMVDLLSNAYGGGKTVLYICDGLVATENQGAQVSKSQKWYSAPFGDGETPDWTNSIFVSQDPIAIDSVCLDFLLAERDFQVQMGITDKLNKYLPIDGSGTADNYLIEAALADKSPSKTVYLNGKGEPIGSLGVHEHWNNATDKQYSRNLGKSEGIELVYIHK